MYVGIQTTVFRSPWGQDTGEGKELFHPLAARLKRILEALHRRADDTGADLADAHVLVGDTGVDDRADAGLDDLADVDAGGAAAEVEG